MDNRTGILASFPRPFPLPTFDCFQYEIRRGEGLGDLVTCDDVGKTDGRHMGGVGEGTTIVIPVEH